MVKNNESYKIDQISFQLGMITCFAEMVNCGVKKLALSPPISPENSQIIIEASDKIIKGFGINSYLEKSLLITDLQSEEFTKNKLSILYYEDDETLKAYLALKERKRKLVKLGQYDGEVKKEIAREFGRLLSYPENKIEEKISKEKPPTPFVLI